MVEKALFGGGCFWCTEAAFSNVKGVIKVTSGYSGGTVPNPSYETICGGESGHAEVIEVKFDPGAISYTDLLTVFFTVHDPTTLNRQGNDIGDQYRSIIFFTNREQRDAAMTFIADLTNEKIFEKPIVTEVKPLEIFYEAETYHQRYYEKNPTEGYCSAIIAPKLKKLRDRHKELLKDA